MQAPITVAGFKGEGELLRLVDLKNWLSVPTLAGHISYLINSLQQAIKPGIFLTLQTEKLKLSESKQTN